VFATLDSSEGRAAFWAESAIERDGVIEFQFINGYCYGSSVVERRPPHVWAIKYMEGLARFDLVPDGQGGTDVLLTHSGLSPDEWNEVYAGWLNVLLPLKAFLAHGIDLRNHDPNRSWDQGYVDQ
jgi:hypothetical protein